MFNFVPGIAIPGERIGNNVGYVTDIIIKRVLVTGAIGYLCGHIFQAQPSLTAQLFAIYEISKTCFVLMCESYYCQQGLTEGQRARHHVAIDFISNALLIAMMYKLNIIALTGTLGLSVLAGVRFSEKTGTVRETYSRPNNG